MHGKRDIGWHDAVTGKGEKEMMLLAALLAGAVLCACSFCHALCDALRAVQCGGEPKGHAVRLQVSLCGALLLPTAAVIWAVYRMPAGL